LLGPFWGKPVDCTSRGSARTGAKEEWLRALNTRRKESAIPVCESTHLAPLPAFFIEKRCDLERLDKAGKLFLSGDRHKVDSSSYAHLKARLQSTSKKCAAKTSEGLHSQLHLCNMHSEPF
jgi:hypothetical protein